LRRHLYPLDPFVFGNPAGRKFVDARVKAPGLQAAAIGFENTINF
jgi:hypothetical protein